MSPAEQPQSTTTPTLMGKYQLGRLLGRGSFAKVYKARSLVDNSIVAIKVIDKQKTVDAAMEPRIMHEISAMRRLHNHPNVLRIDEVLATKSKIYLVMEFASGGELFSKLVRRGKFNESFARYYFQQLVSALHFCHQNGVAHRDMKPQNLLLDKDGNLKISDFGLSALPEHLKNGMLHTACGTPAFTAPEVIARKGYDGFKADAWSCGVILFFLLAGFLPFDDSNVAVLYKKIYQRDYKFPEWISKQAKYVIYRLLDPNPGTRMSLEGVMKTSWFRKSLKSKPESSLFELSSVSRKDAIKGGHDAMNGMNAFDIISLSSGLDLSGLFEPVNKIEKRFTSTASAESILEKVTDIGGKLGYRIERGKGWNLGMGKENFVLMVEVLDIAHSLRLVEVKVVDGAVNFEEIYWGDLKSELQDVVLDWHNDVLGCVRQSLGTNMVAKNLSGAVRTSWDKEGQKNDLEESCHCPRGLLSLDCTHQ